MPSLALANLVVALQSLTAVLAFCDFCVFYVSVSETFSFCGETEIFGKMALVQLVGTLLVELHALDVGSLVEDSQVEVPHALGSSLEVDILVCTPVVDILSIQGVVLEEDVYDASALPKRSYLSLDSSLCHHMEEGDKLEGNPLVVHRHRHDMRDGNPLVARLVVEDEVVGVEEE